MQFFFIFAEIFDEYFFIGNEKWDFTWEILVRSALMFLIIIVGMKILGRRGVKQLSIFELVVIIGLGSMMKRSLQFTVSDPKKAICSKLYWEKALIWKKP